MRQKNSLVIMEGTDAADMVFADFDSGNGKITVIIVYASPMTSLRLTQSGRIITNKRQE